jgi:O-antigen ligase
MGVWLLLLIILIMPFEMSPYLYISPSFLGLIPDFTVIKLLGMLGFAWAVFKIVMLNRRGRGGERVFDSLTAKLFAAMFAGVVVSAILNESPMFAITKYLVFVFFLPFVLVTVRTEEHLRYVMATIVVAMTLVFPYAFRQMGRYDGRLGVGLYEPNYLAANLVLIIPLALAVASYQPTRIRQLAWAGCGLVLTVSLLLTSSRGGFIGLLVAGMVYAYRRLGVRGAVTACLVLIVMVSPTDLGQRALATIDPTAPKPPGVEESTVAHTALFWGGIRMMVDAPIFGVGPQRFKDFSQAYSGLDIPYIAHNTYLELAAEAGLPVLIIFLLLLVATMTKLGRIVRLGGRPEMRRLAAWADGLRTGLLGFAVAGGFISGQYEKFFWLSVFLSIVIARVADRMTAPVAVTEPIGLAPAPRLVPN